MFKLSVNLEMPAIMLIVTTIYFCGNFFYFYFVKTHITLNTIIIIVRLVGTLQWIPLNSVVLISKLVLERLFSPKDVLYKWVQKSKKCSCLDNL